MRQLTMIGTRLAAAMGVAFGFLVVNAPARAGGELTLLAVFNSNPLGGLVDFDGTIYGTTSGGGDTPFGYGTVFKITPTGYTTVYNFQGGSDGYYPTSLVSFGDMLYGTTGFGGQPGCQGYGCGTVFALTPDGKTKTELDALRVVVGKVPTSLTPVGGALYGTAAEGGADRHGSIFKVPLSGGARRIHSFDGEGDGTQPLTPLVKYDGYLYGVTLDGGKYRYGTAFRITHDGQVTTLHDFSGTSADGGFPSALMRVGSDFYGVTKAYGVIFKITADGQFSVLYSLNNEFEPNGPLVKVGNRLYGTTAYGGRSNVGSIFQVTLMGRYRQLYSFPGAGNKGSEPNSGLIYANGKLYGTTVGYHMQSYTGQGTVYSFVPNAGFD